MIVPSAIYSFDQLTTIDWEIEEAITQLKNSPEAKPQFSLVTERFFAVNGVRQFDQETAKAVKEAINQLKKNAKKIHISTGSVTTTELREQLISWFRTEIDAHVFCSFSTDTNQGGGIIVRTPKRQYDVTFKQRILANTDRLAEILR